MIDVGNFLKSVFENFLKLVPVVTVHEYERGVLFGYLKKQHNGERLPWYLWKFMVGRARKRDLRAGFYFYVPFIQAIEIVAIRHHTYHLWKASVMTCDGVSVAVRSNFGYRVWSAWRKYTMVQDFDNTMSAEAEVILTDTIREHTFKQLQTEMKMVEGKLVAALEKRAHGWGAEILTFSITECVACKHFRLIQN